MDRDLLWIGETPARSGIRRAIPGRAARLWRVRGRV